MTLATSRPMSVRLGFSASVSNDIYPIQGIDSIDKWENFDKDNVVSLIYSVRKPVGRKMVRWSVFKQNSISSLPYYSFTTRSAPAGQLKMWIPLFL